MKNLLSHLEEKATRAHYWTSFVPEKRGAQMVEEYGEELGNDLNELIDLGATPEQVADYQAKYERLFDRYLSAKGNCFSAAITGPARFNTRKHEKANKSEDLHYQNLRDWRVKAKKGVIKSLQPEKTYLSEIERYSEELESMKANHELMKEGNKRIREALKQKINIDEYLRLTFGIEDHMLSWTMRFGFGFGLANNNANIKRVEQRIKELKSKEDQRVNTGQKEVIFDGGKIVVNYEADRIQVFFDTRPTREELQNWKNRGLNSFNWSPSNNCWQRKITNNAIWSTKRIFNIQ